MAQDLRAALLLMHRWLGLSIAGFLVLAGLSGCLLAWNQELDAWIYPALTASTCKNPLDPLTIRAQLQTRYPQHEFNTIDLYTPPGKAMVFNLGVVKAHSDFDQVFVNPCTGAVQGTRLWGDPTQGTKNLLPFIHRLHYSLAAGRPGTTLLGVVALLWTLNCLSGLGLTFPPRAHRALPGAPTRRPKSWVLRWQSAWKIRWRGGFAKLNFDLHRATALWLWPVLLTLACSALSLSLPQIYDAALRSVLPHQDSGHGLPTRAPAQGTRQLTWEEARKLGRATMRTQSAALGFSIEHEVSLRYDADRSLFRYTVRSDRDIRHSGGETSVWIDARDGMLRGTWLPTGQAGADTITTWLRTLHKAAVWGAPWKICLVLIGLVLSVVSATGLLIWSRKRHARLARPRLDISRVEGRQP